MRSLLASAALLIWPLAAQAAELPPPVKAMVEAAAKSGNVAKIDAVAAVAKETHPEGAAEVDAIVKQYADMRQREREMKIREAGLFDNWKGSGQLGAALSTGNSETKSLTAGLSLERNGLKWRHRANALLELVDSDGGNDQERVLGGYQLDYKFSDRLYAWGRFEYERNRDAGIKRRFAESAGIGWRVIQPGKISWDLEVGPALRQTKFVTYDENSVAARGASRFSWKLSKTSVFTNETSMFWDESGTVTNMAAITTKMFGSVSARVSYNLAWEEAPPAGLEGLDTTSRITLVYDF